MTAMKGDVINRVRRLPKPSKVAEALQPIFEAVSNAAHAVEDRYKDASIAQGRISVTIKNLKKHAKFEAIIADNGVGLTNERFTAFCTTDTPFKMERGGKGIGRLLWLDAFDDIEINSVFEQGTSLLRRRFRFRLDENDQIVDEELIEAPQGSSTGTTITFKGIRGTSYQKRFPSQANSVVRHFGSHFFADFILERSPEIALFIDGTSATFPRDIRDLLIEDRGTKEIQSEEFGELSISSFVCKKEASADFDGTHQLHFVANGRTVTTRKVDGLLGIGRFGDNDSHVYHGCVSGAFLDERVNQERTNFNFDEKVSDEIAKLCAESVRSFALGPEIQIFEGGRLKTMNDFVEEYPSFQFEAPETLLKRTPKNAVKPEQFAQALIPLRIRRDVERKKQVQAIVSTLESSDAIPIDFAEAVRKAASEVQAEEQRQLTEYVLRRKMVLDVMDVLIRRVREIPKGEDNFHLESTLHGFICPMKVRGDDLEQVEQSDHDLWVIDERLAFARYFASDVPFAQLIHDSQNTERPDLLIFDRLHGLGFNEEESLKNVLLVEFKRPGRPDYDERYSPMNQVMRYLSELTSGRIETFDRDNVRVAPDCIFHCYIVADIVGALDVQTSGWKTTSNGRGRWIDLSGKYRGSIEVIEWRDLILDARARNKAFINAAGVLSPHR
ncbi:ATP-binding protein [Tardiphaga sp. 709]|uniref:ATP-binding protein n=1 Tax=Tardiphaga sp. 709 TaxID=3076039 RepID=UPI0028F09959|nr:ATP-binding protein [Tardiphaga sp. 709]WNV06945.1 ATP-binding protein [Tardiphaga sp. 709]